MWWLVPAFITVGAAYLAWRLCDGHPSRSEWGSLVIGALNLALFTAAAFVSLAAWLIYFIVN